MKISTQYKFVIAIFSIALIVIASSIVLTSDEIANARSQEKIAHNIARKASDLAYVSNDYVVYHGTQQLSQWQSVYASFSQDVSNLKANSPEQTMLIQDMQAIQQRIKTIFDGIVSLTGTSNQTSINSLIQVSWSRMSGQTQAVLSDADQLSFLLQNQADQLNFQNLVLVAVMIVVFIVFLFVIYAQTFRRTLKALSTLEAGAAIVGSGDLNYRLDEGKKDEIGQLSRSFNQMAGNLKNVMASKAELEQTQTLLRASEQRWATTLSSIGDAVISTGMLGNIIFMNKVAEDLTGWTLSAASGKMVKDVFRIVNEQTHAKLENPIDKALKEGVVAGLTNHTVLIRKDGTKIPIDDSAAPIKDKDGKTTGVVLIFRDVTQRKKAEKALQESEYLYRQIFDNSQDGFQLVELIYNNDKVVDYKFLNVNSAYERQTGFKADSVIGKRAKELVPDLEQYWLDSYEKVDKTSTPMHVVNCIQSLNRWFDVYLFSYAKGKIGSLFTDITERKKMEKQLQDSERLAAIGATAGMVGHDIRNPLQAMISDVYLAKTELASLPETEEKQNTLENLDEIQKNIDYVNKIVADLQDYAKPLNPRAQETNIKLLLTEIITKNAIPKDVKVKVTVEEKAEKITADPDYLKRVLSNLILNACQAMANGGKLTIHVYVDKMTNDILITVKDTGVGIPDEIKPKLFTPMITTKSKGQGFGLAVVKRMTEGLGGTVTFESQQEKGTTFIVRIPSKTDQ